MPFFLQCLLRSFRCFQSDKIDNPTSGNQCWPMLGNQQVNGERYVITVIWFGASKLMKSPASCLAGGYRATTCPVRHFRARSRGFDLASKLNIHPDTKDMSLFEYITRKLHDAYAA